VNVQHRKYLMTALEQGARLGNPDVVRSLLKAGAIVNVQDRRGWTPLMVAAGGGHVEVVRLLLGRGANISLVNEQHEDAYAIAQRAERNKILGATKAVELLRLAKKNRK
jgi:ankyrin repeat protein